MEKEKKGDLQILSIFLFLGLLTLGLAYGFKWVLFATSSAPQVIEAIQK